ncbi:MAG: hypothetical protein ACN6O7_12740 [Sphingobacterium sp.]
MREVFKTHIPFGSYIWGVVVIIFIAGISYEDLQRGLYTGALLLFAVFALTWYFTFFLNGIGLKIINFLSRVFRVQSQ